MKPNRRSDTTGSVRSALIAGGIAFVIYFIITALMTGYSSNVLLTSVLIGAGTFVVTWLITVVISALVHRRKGSE